MFNGLICVSAGKELKELIKKLSGNKASSSEEEGGSGMEFEEEMERKDKSGMSF